MRRRLLVALLVLPLSFFSGACSDDSGESPGPDAAVDAAGDAAGDGSASAETQDKDSGKEDGPVVSRDGPVADVAGDTASTPDTQSPDTAPAADLGVTYTGAFPATLNVGFTNVSLVVDGVTRPMTIYKPANLAPNSPLIIACPATDTNGEDGIWDIAANELADQQGLLVVSVAPLVQSKGDWDQHDPGEAYFETYPNETFATNNDLKAVAAAIGEAKRAYGINDKKVFTGGYSNGAFFAQFAALLMPDRITGFASAGGGLVRCSLIWHCVFNGQGTATASCSAMASRPGWCTCSGAEKPQTIPTPATGAFKPAGYIGHAINDDVVSVYYSCQLSERMTTLGYPNKLALTMTGGHNAAAHFMVNAWPYLSTFSRP